MGVPPVAACRVEAGLHTVALRMATAQRDRATEASNGAAGRVRVRHARALDEVDALALPWREMHCRAASPLGQFEWIRACLSAFPDDAGPYVVAGLRDEKLVAVAPLVKRRLGGVCRLFLAGVEELFEPVDLVWNDERALARVVRSLARRGTPLVFERMPADSASLQQLRRAYRGRAIVVVRPRPGCGYIELDESWVEPQRHLDADDRIALARARRSAEALGETATEIHTPDLRDLAELLDKAFDVEAGGRMPEADKHLAEHPARHGCTIRPLAHDPERAVFYRQYAHAACLEGILRVCFLRIGDRTAAVQLAVEHRGAFWLLRAGYDAQFADCSPGLLLTRETIRYAAEAGLTSYEFLSTAPEWTAPWPTREHPCAAVRVYPLGLRGITALAADLGAALLERWRRPPDADSRRV